jgi:phosphatidylglycerol:prolipoprotein diacylglycerol transferase
MDPILFRIPLPFNVPVVGHEIVIFGYGFALVVGFLLAVEVAKFLARRSSIDPELFVNAALIALVAGVIGSRMSHVIENWSDFSDPRLGVWGNFANMINIRSGGLTFYGGLILAFPIVVLYGIYKKVPIRRGMDIAAPAIMIGLGIGRIGCFLNGCCYGAECHVPWKVEFPYYSNAYVDEFYKGEIKPPPELLVPDARGGTRLVKPEEIKQGYATVAGIDGPQKITLAPDVAQIARDESSLGLHPAQLYSTFTALLIAGVLVAFYSLAPPPGRVMALMLILEGLTRFLLEIVRAEPAVAHWGPFGFSLSMILGLALIPVGIIMWLAFADRSAATRAPAVQLAPA